MIQEDNTSSNVFYIKTDRMRPPVPDGVTFIDDDIEASESDLTESDEELPEAFKTPAANQG